MKILLIILLIFLSVSAFGGGSRTGNGGDVVYCPSSPGRPTYQLLDYYELQLIDDERVVIGEPHEDASTKVQFVIDWMRPYSPLRAEAYSKKAQEFFSRVTWSQGRLVDVPDSQEIALPIGCEIRQLAVQQNLNGQVQFTVDQQIWNALSTTDQAGLILHEIIYSEALEGGDTNSINTRELHRFLVRKKMGHLDFEWQVYDFIRELRGNQFTRLVEMPFENGDIGLIEPRSDRYPTFMLYRNEPFLPTHEGSIPLCGYRVKNEFVNHCNETATDSNRYLLVSLGTSRIEKIVKRGSLTPVYQLSLKELNLPFPVLDYWPFSMALPAEDVTFKYEKVTVSCAKEKWIEFDLNGKSEFDVNARPLLNCTSTAQTLPLVIRACSGPKPSYEQLKHIPILKKGMLSIPRGVPIWLSYKYGSFYEACKWN